MSTNSPIPGARDRPDAKATRPAYSERKGHPNMDDWHAMLHAVKGRLQLTASAAAPGMPAAVLDCVDALDRLQIALQHEHNHRQCLERDISEAQAALAQMRARLHRTQVGERTLRHQAMHDPLTALPNRSCFREGLDRALSFAGLQRQTLAVMYIDLDGFKPINDRHGHGIGDEVLRIVALRLAHTVRAKDLVSRLGGDEFACLVADWEDRAQLSRLARKMFDAVAAPLSVGELRLTVRPSIGIALYPTHGLGPDELVANADAAMYRAKRGQSGVAFCEDRAPG
jgi:diguanylate cyclase (GGDEF)-like protein